MIKLICTDVDGTLLNKNREIDKYTLDVFNRLNGKIPVVLASSRMPKALWHLQKDLNIEKMPLICYNGALLLSSGGSFEESKIIDSVTIPEKTTRLIMDLAVFHQVHISLYHNNNWLASAMDYWTEREISNTRVNPDGLLSELSEAAKREKTNYGAHKIMIMGEPAFIDQIATALGTTPAVALCRSKDTYLEITPRQTNKSRGLGTLLNKVIAFEEITPADIIAFGDNHNDLELLRDAKYGIAVSNGIAEIKNIAFAITKSNIEHGVAIYLDQMLIKGRKEY